MRRWLGAVAGLVFLSSFSSAAKSITVKGSDTMVILGQRWAEGYMQTHSGSVVQVTGGGSGTGIAALINGATDIAMSSRHMKDKEKIAVKKQAGKDVVEIPVALDGISVYAPNTNPIDHLSMQQLRDIYLGKITRWEELGIPNLGPIVVYGRENNSGTYAYFKEHVLMNEDFAPEVLSLPGTAAVMNAVSKDKRGIGYGGIAYSKGAKILKISADGIKPAVDPSLENVAKGVYPLSRELYFYTAGAPKNEVKDLIDWVQGPDGQIICKDVGYFPLTKKKR